MLSTLLQNVQTFLGRAFLVAFFVPSLFFAFCNAAALYWMNNGFRSFADGLLDGGTPWHRTLAAAVAVVATACLGYVLSAVSGFLRSLLEGRWPEWLCALFRPAQASRLHALEKARDKVIEIRHALETEKKPWEELLSTARSMAPKFPRDDQCDSEVDDVMLAIDRLTRRVSSGQLLKAADAKTVVDKLRDLLDKYDANDVPRLDLAQQRLPTVISAGVKQAIQHHIRLVNEIQFNFGLQDLAPTSMGNVANTVQSYAISRYNLNFEVFWSRLQRAIQRDEKAYTALQDSKIQLDFLVSSCCLTFLWASTWALALALCGSDWHVFVILAIGGPVASYVWYRIAVEQYRAFADVLRTAVDEFRFELLKDLHIQLPADLLDELEVWDALNRLSAYGETPNPRFQHPKAS